jgi:hypothetical protein
VPELAVLSVGETAVAMQDWARRADAMLGGDSLPIGRHRETGTTTGGGSTQSASTLSYCYDPGGGGG